MNSGIPVKVFSASVIERYFYNLAVSRRITERQVTQPIVHIHPVTTTRAATAIAFTTGNFTACST
jgi:hypothetical protein